jgi:hypothetical protein
MGGGGQTPSTTVQQTKQSNEPPAYIQPYLQKGIQDLTALYDKGTAPGYYPGATVAAPSANTQAALSALYERGVRGSPYGKSIMANLDETMGGKYLDVDANPYFQKALAAGFRPQNEQFMQEVVPGLDGRFAGAGRYGSGAHTGTTDRAVDSLNRAQADAAAKASSSAYDAERSRMLNAAGTAAGLFPQLQAADYQDINAMGQAGAGWDRYNQSLIDSDIARYNYNANKDWNYINRYLASLNAGYPGGEMNGTVRGSAMPSTNPSADMWNTIFKGAGVGLSALSMFGASDRRLKEDITPVGALNDGQTVYSYRYKGDPRTQIGLLAQEVERVHPDAVTRHPSGYRMVDYRRATRSARSGQAAASAPGGLM